MKWDTLKPVVVLVTICLVVSAALAGTHHLTQPVIEAAKLAEANRALLAVLPEGKDFEEVPTETENALAVYRETGGGGYVVKAQGKGFDDMVVAMVGIGCDGLMTGVRVVEHNESINPDFDDETFIGQFVGKDYSLDGVEFISGATFSSRGLASAISAAYAAYGEAAGVSVPSCPDREIVLPDPETVAELIGEGACLLDVAGTDGVYAGAGGFAFNMTAAGFGGDIHVLVGIGPDGSLLGARMFSHGETPDYGADLAKEFYGKKFAGLRAGDEIPMRSGATVTSTGYRKCVEDALAAFEPAVRKLALMRELLPGDYTELPVPDADGSPVRHVYSSGGGFLFDTESDGFGGKIRVLIAMDPDGAVRGARMYEHEETPDYGADLAKEFYGKKFIGLRAGDEIPMRSGATVTSTGYRTCVEAAFGVLTSMKGA